MKNEERAIRIYPVDFPEGEPYQPSNGTEGEIFMSHWCNKCSIDKFTEDGTGESCKILLDSIIGKQPKEWKYASNGAPLCTAFVMKTSKSKSLVPIESPGQLSLFEVA
jgi:hypothetical protein